MSRTVRSRPGFEPRSLVLLVFFLAPSLLSASTNVSVWVAPGTSGRMLARPDPLGNRLLDYSGVGYKGGLAPIPNVPVKVTISPVAGDNVANVQGAINQVSALAPDTNGFRGAVLLNAGEYPLASTVKISAGGVILRGVGSGTNGSVLRATGSSQYTLVSISGSGSAATVSGTTHNITNNYVPVGARSFSVDSLSGLALGDHVFVRRVATSNWIHDLGMDLLCCAPSVNAWTPSGYMIDSDRVITRLEGTRVFIDAPLTCAIDRAYTNGTIRKYTWSGRIQLSGIEHLRGVSNFTNATDENHGWTFVQFNSIENGWARDVVSQYFGYSCVSLSSGARFVTVADCQSLDPISQITGGRRYAFVLDDCNMCLVQNCYTKLDRHQFVTQSLTTGPNVFVDGLSDSAQADAGPHHRWGTGAIWDNVTINGNNLNVQNRGNLGSGHGWSGANEVVWNCDADGGYVVQNPPTAHNWLIGSIGAIENGTVYVGPHDPGTYDSHGSNVFPNSLYYAQLQDRLAAPGLQAREYWLGEIGRFTNNVPGGELVPVDPAWRTAVQTAAAGASLDGFDVVAANHWLPFTFNFTLATNEHILGASLAVSLLASGLSATNDLLYLDSVTNGFSFGSLGWLPISTAVSNPTVRVLDLSSQLSLLADGRLNLAVQNDVGIDWALLELQVAPNISAGTMSLTPAADATVRGGASANSNFGTATTLTTKEDSLADNDRRAFLRWDLSGVTGIVYQARVRLTPVGVGTNAIEQGVALSTNHAWSENSITWNNQPFAGKRFATWIPGTNAPLEFIVTPQVLDALAGDKQLTLELFSLRNFGAAGTVDYASRESSDPASRPQLLLVVSELPPTVSAFTNLSIPVNASTGPLPFSVSDDKTAVTDLTIIGGSSNTNLVPSANVVFGGSGSNRTVTVTPASNQNGQTTITVTVTDTAGLSSSQSFTLTVSSHPPSLLIWNGPGPGSNPWSTTLDWSPAALPETLDDVKFFDAGAAGVAASNVNNFVDAAFGSTIASLQYGNTNGNHTTLIAAGRDLTVANSLTVGTGTDNGIAQIVNTTITGPGASLTLAGGDCLVRQATDGASGGSQRATLNLSGLDVFDASVNRLVVGSEGPFARVTGTLFLARTNQIIATGSSPAVAVGGAGGGSGNAGGSSFLYLGKDTAIFADSLAVGRGKQGVSGGLSSSLRFNPAFTNSNPALGGTVFMRAADGTSRMTSWNLGDSGSGGGTVNTAGACDFTGGTVDARVNTIVVGKSSTGGGLGNPSGSLTLHAGTIDVDTLQLGYQSISGSNSASGSATLNGGMLLVNSTLELAHVSGGTGAASTSGTLNLNGGAAQINSIVAGAGSGPTLVAINSATLILTNTAGSLAAPIGTIALTNANLQLLPGTNAPSLVAGSLVTGPGTTTLTILSLPAFTSYPVQLKLIQYSGTIAGAGFNFVLGPLPDSPICGAYLSNNLGSVDLVITNCFVPDTFLTWDGSVDGTWDTKTANWKNNVGPGLVYSPGDSVVFNDAASGITDINLAETLAPAQVTVSNNLKAYAFVDVGKISGAGNLVKQGPGTLILANESANDFTGGITISGGELRVGDGATNGALPDGAVINNARLVFDRGDELTMAGAISGSGSITNRGTGTLRLSGSNSFAGQVTATAGILQVANNSALGATSSGTLILPGASLDLNHFNIGLEPLTVSGSGSGGQGALVDNSGNSSFLSPQSIALVTLADDTTFGGTGRWDLRSANTSATNAVLSTTGHAYNLAKVGTNQVSLVAVLVDPALGDIDVQAGVLSVEKVITSLGNPARTLSISNGATLQFFQVSNVLSKTLLLKDGAIVFNNNGTNTFGGPVTLQGSNTFNAGGTWLRFTNVLSGPGSLVKVGGSPLFLAASNTYSGDTLVTAGTLALTNSGAIDHSARINVAAGALLDVSGRNGGSLILAPGQLLQGNGTINGALAVLPGATISPGASIGALTATNSIALAGVTAMELNKTLATNDIIRTFAGINYGGTLALTNLAGALGAGDGFRLFVATNYSGAFTNLAPPSPGAGLAWDTSQLTINGTLRVVAATGPVINNIALSGTNVVVSGAGGSVGPYYVLTSTNVALPLGNWTRTATNIFGPGGTFVFTNAVIPGAAQSFFVLQLP